MFRPHPISLLQFGVYWIVVVFGAIALVRAFARAGKRDADAKRSRLSTIGIALQTIAFAAVGFGPIRFALPWSAPSSLICSLLVAVLGGSAVAVFVAATNAMGKNWSIVARTRSDHELVRTGPFAVVRHPIYLALLLYLLGFGIAFGHFGQFVVGLPFYFAGTWLRIRVEEAMLRAQFGDEHARYVRDVPAVIPFIF